MISQSEAVGPSRSSNRIGTCATCGAKRVLVTSPPLPRHVDMRDCDVQRALNIIARRLTGRAR